MSTDHSPSDVQERADPSVQATDEIIAWEEIETGRFMPRRIRGSYRGGKLG